jgi:hypothetical protein
MKQVEARILSRRHLFFPFLVPGGRAGGEEVISDGLRQGLSIPSESYVAATSDFLSKNGHDNWNDAAALLVYALSLSDSGLSGVAGMGDRRLRRPPLIGTTPSRCSPAGGARMPLLVWHHEQKPSSHPSSSSSDSAACERGNCGAPCR